MLAIFQSYIAGSLQIGGVSIHFTNGLSVTLPETKIASENSGIPKGYLVGGFNPFEKY